MGGRFGARVPEAKFRVVHEIREANTGGLLTSPSCHHAVGPRPAPLSPPTVVMLTCKVCANAPTSLLACRTQMAVW